MRVLALAILILLSPLVAEAWDIRSYVLFCNDEVVEDVARPSLGGNTIVNKTLLAKQGSKRLYSVLVNADGDEWIALKAWYQVWNAANPDEKIGVWRYPSQLINDTEVYDGSPAGAIMIRLLRYPVEVDCAECPRGKKVIFVTPKVAVDTYEVEIVESTLLSANRHWPVRWFR